MRKILLAMIALLFAVSAVPVAYADNADEAAANEVTADEVTADEGTADEGTADSGQEELPPLIDPAIADDNA